MYNIHHLDGLANGLAEGHPDLIPAQTPQLLLQIGHHQEDENLQGRGLILYLGIVCLM